MIDIPLPPPNIPIPPFGSLDKMLSIGINKTEKGFRFSFASGDASVSKVYPENNSSTRLHFAKHVATVYGRNDEMLGDYLNFVWFGKSVFYRVEEI